MPLVAQLKTSSNSVSRLVFCHLPLPRLFPCMLSQNVVFLARFGFFQLFLPLGSWLKKGVAGSTPPCPFIPLAPAGFPPHRTSHRGGKQHRDGSTGCPEHWFVGTGCQCGGIVSLPCLHPCSHASSNHLQGKIFVISFFLYFIMPINCCLGLSKGSLSHFWHPFPPLSLALGTVGPGRSSANRRRCF